MTRQIVLLRGVNLGANRRLSMADLRAVLVDLGYDDAQTFLQSGNAVLSSSGSAKSLEEKLERELASRLGLQTEVHVRTRAELANVVARDPLADVAVDPSRYQVTFLRRPPSKAALRELEAADLGRERFAVSGRELYAWHPDGFHASPLAKLLGSRKLGLGGTARNWNTVTRLLARAED
jgi:uncharacterized protein (DUF1697 family)